MKNKECKFIKENGRWRVDGKIYFGEDSLAVYARSYKCKYDKQTDELLSRDVEAFSTYYKNIG